MAAPTENGSFNGEVRKVIVPYGRASSTSEYWAWDEAKGEWTTSKYDLFNTGKHKIPFAEAYQKQQLAIKNGENPAEDNNKIEDKTIKLNAGPIGGGKVDGKTQKWPNDAIESTTDYVFFQFGKYVAPFGRDAQSSSGSTFNKRAGYISVSYTHLTLPTILLV